MFAIGTAAFGMPYGITNTVGIVAEDEIVKILDFARGHGIDTLDTAAAYGTSEEVVRRLAPDFKIITKLRKGEEIGLGVEAVLLHDVKDLSLIPFLRGLKEDGYTKKIGISIYSPEDAVFSFGLDITQLPLNILDQRPLANESLWRIQRRGGEVHVRSIFLQGVLLQNPESLPPYFDSIKPHLTWMRHVAEDHGLSSLEMCVAFIQSVKAVTLPIIGVTSLKELEEIYTAFLKPKPEINFSQFAISDPKMIDPRHWPKS